MIVTVCLQSSNSNVCKPGLESQRLGNRGRAAACIVSRSHTAECHMTCTRVVTQRHPTHEQSMPAYQTSEASVKRRYSSASGAVQRNGRGPPAKEGAGEARGMHASKQAWAYCWSCRRSTLPPRAWRDQDRKSSSSTRPSPGSFEQPSRDERCFDVCRRLM